MTQDQPTKKYPASTSEVAKMLGLPSASDDLPMSSFTSHSDLPVANLPIVMPADPSAISKDSQPAKDPSVAGAVTHAQTGAALPGLPTLEQIKTQESAYVKLGKQLLPYAAIFTVGLFLYYFFFSSLNLNINLNVAGILGGNKTNQVEAAPQQSAILQLEQQDMAGYNSWILGFYYDVKDPKVIDPNTDNSGNGLTNFEKYLLNLNPKSYDTLGLGLADSQDLANGISPTTGDKLTDNQKNIIAKYIDMEAVNNRLALESLQNPEKVAGAATGNSSFNIRGAQTVVGGAPANSNSTPNSNSAPSSAPANPINSNSAPSVFTEGGQNVPAAAVSGTPSNNSVSINTAVSGQLIIPNLKINVPIIWSQDPSGFETDLQSGVVHYPGTAMPGETGTTYIAGHSSNYAWAKGGYNQIFSHLGNLTNDTAFQITVTTTQGKQVVYHYVVVRSGQYSPTDPAQFQNTGQSLVALSTCWPVGSTAKRLVVFAQLVSVDK